MHYHNHKFTYDENERRKRQNSESILALIGLKKDQVFIDLGANDGYFSVPASKIVGKKGQIYAIDIDREALDRLVDKANQSGLTNIKTIQAAAEEEIASLLAKADIIFLGTVLHDFQDPLKSLINAKRMLKPGGAIYNLDWQKTETNIGPPYSKRFSEDYVIELASKADLKASKMDFNNQQYYLFKLIAN